MRTFTKTLIAVCFILHFALAQAQLTVVAGNDYSFCAGGVVAVTLGGNPTAVGGTPPYAYLWSDGQVVANPIVSPGITTSYSVTVTDNTGATATDVVNIFVFGSPVVEAGPDVYSCQQLVQLGATITPNQSGVGPACSGTNLQTQIGHDTLMFPFIPLNHPSVLGNYAHSYRNQMLYTAAELSVAMGGSNTINKVGFNVTRFNSSAFLENYTIRIGATNQTTLSTWDNSLTTVYSSAGITPYAGFNLITLDNGFVWDGVSNLIVEVCMYSPTGFNNQPNDVASSITATNSYLYSYGSVDQCGGVNPPTASNLRPNLLFDYCNPSLLQYTIQWSPATGLSNPQVYNPTATLQGTTTFHVTVTGYNGCVGSDSVKVTLSDLKLVIDTIAKVTCAGFNDGSIALNHTGGSAPYTYSINGGPQQGTGIFTGLTSGTYLAQVIDAGGCTDTVTCVLGETYGVSLNVISQVPVSCFGNADGSFNVQLSGGAAPYQYSIDGGLTYQQAGAFNGLPAGVYTVIGHDAIGCASEVPVVVAGPAQVVVNIANTGDGFLPDTLDVTVTGGCSPYVYSWAGGIATSYNIISTAGTYGVTVTDCGGCTATASAPAGGISYTTSQTNVTCFSGNNGSATLTVITNTPPPLITWSNGGTGPTISNLPAGTYTYTYSDALPAHSFSGSITIGQPTQIQIAAIVTPVLCNGGSNGAVDLTVTGGAPAYTYTWSPAGQTEDLSGVPGGTYIVTVTDANSCTAIETAMVTESAALVATIAGTGTMPDTLTVLVTGGTCGNYSFSWSNGANDSIIEVSVAGTYQLTVTDCICAATATYTVNSLSISSIVNNVTCNGSSDGSITLNATGGTAPYLYSINGGPTVTSSNVFLNLPAGAYSVVVRDTLWVIGMTTITIAEPDLLQIDSITTTNVSCSGMLDGQACIHTSGGTPDTSIGASPYTYYWGFGNVIDTCRTGLTAGTYTVTFIDAHNCTAEATFSITEPAQLTIDAITINGVNTPDSLVQAVVSGGTLPYDYLWSTGNIGAINAMPTCLDFEIIVTVTDANGCIGGDSVDVSANVDCVWPGDADDNGIADNNDLLSIGLSYGTTGIVRSGANLNWYGQLCDDWADTLTGGINYKHIDCNGNGIINSDDTLAIVQNFGEVHNKNDESRDWRAGAAVLYVDLIPDTTHAGDTLYANLILGDASIAAANVYGLAFTLNYDVNVVDTLFTKMTFGNSWLGTATDKIHIAKDLKDGQIKCAVTRIDHTMRSGAGQIGQATFVITTDNINGKDLAYYGAHVWVSDVLMIDNEGNELDVNEGQDSTQVEFEPLSVGSLQLAVGSLKMQPNPATDAVQITVTRELIGGNLKVLDLEGRSLMAMPVTSSNFKLETAELSAGIYLVQVNTNFGTLTKRLIIAK